MLRLANEIKGYSLSASDGEIGNVHDLLFDDETWEVRYFVVDTGGWLPGRKVLIAPEAFGRANWIDRVIDVDLTKEQIKASPKVDTDKPVSRQHETDYRSHYDWPQYWAGATESGDLGHRAIERPAGDNYPAPAEVQEVRPPDLGGIDADPGSDDVHLRSLREVTGYDIEAVNGEIGHVDDLVLDDENWSVRYMVVDTGKFLPGKRVLISPEWIARTSWEESSVIVDVTREQLKDGPEFDPSTPVNRQYEERLYDFYGRPTYWP